MIECIGGWTIETLRQHILAILEEQDKRLDARFTSQEVGRVAAALEFQQYKSTNNEWRGALDDSRRRLVTREEWSASHHQFEQKFDVEFRSRDQRMDSSDRDRNSLRERLVKIESRAGYVSLGVIMSGASLLITLAVGAMSIIRLAH